MPILDTIIPETTKQIIEPVSDQIAKRLLSILGLWSMFKDNYHLLSDDLKTGAFTSPNSTNQRVPDNRCDVLIIPNYNPLQPALEGAKGKDAEAQTTTRKWLGGTIGEFPIFSDAGPNVYLHEVDVPCSVELEFTIKSRSIELADIISTALYSKSLTGGSVYDYNDLIYTYPIPDRALILLHQMYKMQEAVAAEVKFDKYLELGSNGAITIIENRHQLQAGSKQFIVQRTATKVVGKLEYDGGKPDPESVNKVTDRYSTTFRYVFQLGRPALLRTLYPIMVNNQLVATRFIRRPQGTQIGEAQQVHPNKAINDYFRNINELSIDLSKRYPLIQYPDYDDFIPAAKIYPDFITQYQPIFIGLMSLDVDPADGSLSLTVDIKDEIFPMLAEDVRQAITQIAELDYTTDHFQQRTDLFRRLSIFNIAIFADDHIIDYRGLHLDHNLILNVYTKFDVGKRYRIVISQIREIRILNQYYIHHMLSNPDYYLEFLAYHLKYLVETNYLKIVKDELTKGLSITRQRAGLQVFKSSSGPHPVIRLGRYVVEPTRIR